MLEVVANVPDVPCGGRKAINAVAVVPDVPGGS